MSNDIAQSAGLLSVLSDKSAPLGDRHDAAMDLAAFEGLDVQVALLEVLQDLEADKLLVEAAAESYGEIWTKTGRMNFDSLTDKMHPVAQEYFRDFFSSNQ